MAAEGYLNFGYPGVFVELLAMGLVTRFLMIYFAAHPSAGRAMILIGIWSLQLYMVRNHLNVALSQSVQMIIFVWLLSKFCRDELSPIGESAVEASRLQNAPEQASYVQAT